MINEQIDTVYTPNQEKWERLWHGKQTVIEDKLIAVDGSNIPHVFNPIMEVPMNPQFPDDFELNEDTQEEVDKWKVICADCREGKSGKIHPLHVPKKGYQIHDNKLLFDCMTKAATEVLGDNNFELVTVGTLGGYTQFFMSIAIKGQETFTVGDDDIWSKYFNLISSHNSVVSSSFMLSMIRMVCMNTVQAAIAESEKNDTNQKIRHSKESLSQITPKAFEKTLKSWIDNAEIYKNQLTMLKSQTMDLNQFRAFSAGVFTEAKSDMISTTSYNRVTEMENLFVRGIGNKGINRYDALNAWTEYFTSGNGAGKVGGAKKLARANFGKGNDWKREAFRVLTDEKEFKIANERGNRLMNDRALMVGAN
jgi:hypothetical protein